jgi:transcriptional regulator with XRE-family HTH domain
MITIRRKIRYLRQQHHMTQKELGQALGFSQSTADVRIAQYESGARAPKAQLLRRIALVLEVDPVILRVDIPETEEEWRAIRYWIHQLSSNHQ